MNDGAQIKIQITDDNTGKIMEFGGRDVMRTFSRAKSAYIRKYRGGN